MIDVLFNVHCLKHSTRLYEYSITYVHYLMTDENKVLSPFDSVLISILAGSIQQYTRCVLIEFAVLTGSNLPQISWH